VHGLAATQDDAETDTGPRQLSHSDAAHSREWFPARNPRAGGNSCSRMPWPRGRSNWKTENRRGCRRGFDANQGREIWAAWGGFCCSICGEFESNVAAGKGKKKAEGRKRVDEAKRDGGNDERRDEAGSKAECEIEKQEGGPWMRNGMRVWVWGREWERRGRLARRPGQDCARPQEEWRSTRIPGVKTRKGLQLIPDRGPHDWLMPVQ
jgi:hypothetical protein